MIIADQRYGCAHYEDMRLSVETLKLRRMRIQNEISLSTEEGAHGAEDLEALSEELCS
jgi:hypothetical protein